MERLLTGVNGPAWDEAGENDDAADSDPEKMLEAIESAGEITVCGRNDGCSGGMLSDCKDALLGNEFWLSNWKFGKELND